MDITLQQLQKILSEVKKQLLDKKRIKYVNADYDNRDGKFWKITFRHWGGHEETIFTNTNRPIAERRNLYEEIMEWLDEKS